jgi:hypothetical protein
MVITQSAALTDKTVLAVLLAESTTEVAEALTAALGVPAAYPAEPAPTGHDSRTDTPEAAVTDPAVDQAPTVDATPADDEVPASAADEPQAEPAAKATRARRSTGGAQIAAGGAPAAVQHTDGLWLTDGTCIELAEPIVHVGQVAELAYAHHIGFQLTPKFSEPGQIWITEDACSSFGIAVEAISRRDRAKSLRQLTEGIDFVTLAVNEGWSLGGAGEDPSAHRLGSWTRVYREDKRGVMIALIPGMGAGQTKCPCWPTRRHRPRSHGVCNCSPTRCASRGRSTPA